MAGVGVEEKGEGQEEEEATVQERKKRRQIRKTKTKERLLKVINRLGGNRNGLTNMVNLTNIGHMRIGGQRVGNGMSMLGMKDLQHYKKWIGSLARNARMRVMRRRRNTTQPATKVKKTKEKSRTNPEKETPSGASAENPKKKPKKAKDDEEVEIDQAQLKKDTKKIQKYIALFSGKKKCEDVSDKLKEEIRAHLQLSELVEGRLNIYWKRPACGVHSRSQKFDLATFAIPDADGVHFVSRLAAAVKCAELFVTCLQLTYILKSQPMSFPQ